MTKKIEIRPIQFTFLKFCTCLSIFFTLNLRNYISMYYQFVIIFQTQFVVDEVSNIIKESIENTIGGNGYAHPKVSQWTNAVVESCLASLTKLQKPFKYIGNYFIKNSKFEMCMYVMKWKWLELIEKNQIELGDKELFGRPIIVLLTPNVPYFYEVQKLL